MDARQTTIQVTPDQLQEMLTKLGSPLPGVGSLEDVKIKIDYKLEKFDGEHDPEKEPVETKTGTVEMESE